MTGPAAEGPRALTVLGGRAVRLTPRRNVYASPDTVGPRIPLTPATLNGPNRVQSTADGQVISGLDVPTGAHIYVLHQNVTVRDCRVRADGANYAVHTNNAATLGTIVEHCELGATEPQPTLLPTGGAGLITLIRGCNIYNVVDGGRGGTGVVFEDNWVHDLVVLDLGTDITHNDGWQASHGTGMIVRRNRIEVPVGGNAAVFCKGDQSVVDDVLIEDNYLDGGGYTLYISQNNLGVTNVVARRNTFGPNFGYGRIGPRTGLTMIDNIDQVGAAVL